jgi:hypothetical protein
MLYRLISETFLIKDASLCHGHIYLWEQLWENLDVTQDLASLA